MLGKFSTTLLLTRHILRTMTSHVLRTAIVWLALAAALGVVIGVFSFTRSIDDSHRARGQAIRGVAQVQVEAVGQSVLPKTLAGELEDLPGTRHAVAVDELRVGISSKHRVSHVATAFGIDRRARLLKSALQKELDVKTPKDPDKGGLTISREMAATLGVKRGDKVRVIAFTRSPRIKIERIQKVSPALSEVVAIPLKSLRKMRGESGSNRIYVQLKRGVSAATWTRRAADKLPKNALVVTPDDQQRQLDRVLNVTVRSYTYIFGAIALLIVTLLVYVLQLMRMLDRQEDAGLVRALGSNTVPLAAAEILTLLVMMLPALPAGYLVGKAFAHQLAGNLPEYLTQVFNFTLVVEIKPGLVAIAVAGTLTVAILATLGALLATRRPVADQLGRSPQSGATATAGVALPVAVALTVGGLLATAASLNWADSRHYTLTSILTLLGVTLAAPGIAALLAHGLTRFHVTGGPSRLVARSAIESHPRRVAISTAIMAMAVSAIVPMQLVDNALVDRVDELSGIHRETVQRVVAGDDLFSSVPVAQQYIRRVTTEKPLKVKVKTPTPVPGQPPPDPAKLKREAVRETQERERRRPLPDWSSPFVTGFTPYRGQLVSLLALDSRRTWPFVRKPGDESRKQIASRLRSNRTRVVISKQLSAWSGLEEGDKIALPTPEGVRKSKVAAVIDDMTWPLGSVYFDITRYRRLFDDDAINVLIVRNRSYVDNGEIADRRPLHTYSGAQLRERIKGQMDKQRENMLAMRWMIVLAALVAVGGILATSVLARRREWGVLRAAGLGKARLFTALAIEIAVILVLGSLIGVAGGIVSFRGPINSFMDSQGFSIGDEIVLMPLLGTAGTAVGVGFVAVSLSAIAVARTKLTEALSYE